MTCPEGFVGSVDMCLLTVARLYGNRYAKCHETRGVWKGFRLKYHFHDLEEVLWSFVVTRFFQNSLHFHMEKLQVVHLYQ
jgi:hypothetical protein